MLAGQMEYMVPSNPLTIRNPNLFNNCPMYNKQFSTTWFIRHIAHSSQHFEQFQTLMEQQTFERKPISTV